MSDNIKFWEDLSPVADLKANDKLMVVKNGEKSVYYTDISRLPYLSPNDFIRNTIQGNQWNPIIVDAVNPSDTSYYKVSAYYSEDNWIISRQEGEITYYQTLVIVERATGTLHVLEPDGTDNLIQYIDLATLFNYNIGSVNHGKATTIISVDYFNTSPQTSAKTGIAYNKQNRKWGYRTYNNGESISQIDISGEFVVYAIAENKFYLCQPDGDSEELIIRQGTSDFKDIFFLGAAEIPTVELEEFKSLIGYINEHESLISSELSRIKIGDKVGVPYLIEGYENKVAYTIGTVESIELEEASITSWDVGYMITDNSIGNDGKAATITIKQTTEGEEAGVINEGTDTELILNFILPKGTDGNTGEKGEQGDKGADGITPTLTIGNVVTIEEASQAKIDTTETDTGITLDFYLPKGEKGQDGTTGTQGDKGAKGQSGKTPAITIGTVTTANTGSQLKIEKTGTDTEPVYNFTIPRGLRGEKGQDAVDGQQGNKGADGKSATLSIGTVTATTSGQALRIVQEGTEIHTVLNFTIPRETGDRGDKGDKGSRSTERGNCFGLAGTGEEFLQIIGSLGSTQTRQEFYDEILTPEKWYNIDNDQSQSYPKAFTVMYDSLGKGESEGRDSSEIDLFAFIEEKTGFPIGTSCYCCRADIMIRPIFEGPDDTARGFYVDAFFHCPYIDRNDYYQEAVNAVINFLVLNENETSSPESWGYIQVLDCEVNFLTSF